MRIDDFTLENWLNPACDSEKNKYYLGGSCVLPMTVEELFDLTGESMENFFEELKHMNLGYPRFEGTPRTRKALSKLYKNVEPDEVILCHGGTGANATVCYALIEKHETTPPTANPHKKPLKQKREIRGWGKQFFYLGEGRRGGTPRGGGVKQLPQKNFFGAI